MQVNNVKLVYSPNDIAAINDELAEIFQALESCIGDTEPIERAAKTIKAALYKGYFDEGNK